MKFAVLITMVALSLGAAVPAAAQQPQDEPSVTDKETARGLVVVGHERFAEGDHRGALKAYHEADAIMGVPTTSLLVAKAHLELGELLEGRDALLRVTRFPRRPDEPKAFASARKEAKEQLSKLEGAIPTLRLSVATPSGPLGEGAAVTLRIDGRSYEGVAALVARHVNPGPHELVVAAPGYETVTQRIEVPEGEDKLVEVVLEPGGDASRPEAAPASTPPSASLEDEGGASYAPIMTYVGFGVGGAGIVVAAITGGLSFAAAGDVKEVCPELSDCPEAAREPHDRAILLSNVANVGVAVGVVGVALGVTGVVLWSLEPGPSEQALSLQVGPGALRFEGSF